MISGRTYVWTGLAGLVLCGGCLATQKEQISTPLPQWVHLISINAARLKSGSLYVMGKGRAKADGGKYLFQSPGLFSSNQPIEMTITSDQADALQSCLQNLMAAREGKQPIDIRGLGTFNIKSVIDPPLETGEFALNRLDVCGTNVSSAPVTAPAASTATLPAGDLVAVPERYLDHRTVISGTLVSAVQFGDPVTHLNLQSESQFLAGYFLTASLAADSRLSLVRATPGSLLVLEGTLTRVTPKSLAAQSAAGTTTGYEFDISAVVSIEPATPQP